MTKYRLLGVMSLLLAAYSTLSAQERDDSLNIESRETTAVEQNQTGALFALKTNVLFDVVTAFNGELEIPFGRDNRWSIMAEYWCPWMVWSNNSRAIELQTAGLELRYWFERDRSQKKVLTGWFGGIYYANGKYDFEWNSKGDQGEFNSVGATIGYSWSIHRRWNLELSGSIGHLWGPRRHYEATDNGDYLLWQYTTNSTYTGPTKLKVSFVWLLGQRRQDKSRKEGLN
jgi:hypothetical protein